MMVRRLVVLLLVLIVSEESFARCGKERWHIKTGIDPQASSLGLTTPHVTTIAKLITIPRQNVTKSLPDDQRFAPIETTPYAIDATLTGYKIENDPKSGDSDYHLLIADANGNSMDAEIPDPHCVDATSVLFAGITKARAEFDKVFTPTDQLQATDTPIHLVGFGFWDRVHGAAGSAKNGVEIHPVIDIAFPQPVGKSFVVPLATSPAVDPEPEEGTPPTTTTTLAGGGESSAVPPSSTVGSLRHAHLVQAYTKTKPNLLVHFDDTQDASTVTLTGAAGAVPPGAERNLDGKVDSDPVGTGVVVRVDKTTANLLEQVETSLWARVGALLLGVLFLWAVTKLFFRGRSVFDLVCGKDGLYSNSKVQAALWFGVLIITYVAASLLRAYMAGLDHMGGISVPSHLALLSGISAFTFGAAKAIRSAKEAAKPDVTGAPTPDPNRPVGKRIAQFLFDMTHGTDGSADMGDFQIIVITLLAVFVYLVQVWAWLSKVPVTVNTTLPDVDTTILAVFGLGQGAYLFKKQATDPSEVETQPTKVGDGNAAPKKDGGVKE